MSNYRFDITKLDGKPTWSIYELQTDQVIQKYKNERQARDTYRGLKRGKGFNGWTPMFFAKEVK